MTTATYADTTAPSGATSYYRVTAVDTSANESAANVANALRPSGDVTPPNAPSNATATGSQTTISLDWADNTESDLAGYNVYRAGSQFGTYTKLNTTLLTSSQYSDTSAPAGATSWYHITAVDNSGNESVATTVSAIRTPDTTPPAVPSGLTATPGKRVQITLDWADSPESDLAGYNVYSSSSVSGPFTKLNSSLLTVSTFVDTNAAQGTATFYHVTAVDTSGNESTDADVSATRPDSIPPAAPTSVTASGSFSGILISWVNGTELDFAGINVYRSAAVDGIFTKVNSSPIVGTSFVDTAAPGGATSFYQVTAVDQSGNESTPATASTFRPDLGQSANANDIAYDSTGVLHLAYYDTVATTIKYASRDTGGTWSAIQIVDTSGDDVGGNLSIAVNSQNQPAVAYFDGTRGDLRYAILVNGSWNVQTVDSKNSVGLFPSLKFDSSDHPVIAYYKKTTGDLRVAQFDGTNWNITQVATADDVGRSASLAKQPNGLWAIAYENSTAGRLQYAYQTNASTWQNVTVDTSTAGISYISLAFDTSGRASISYQETGLGDLKFALNKSGKWTTGTIASKGSVGMYTRLVFGSDGMANIFYYSKQLNTLMLAKGFMGSWTISQLQANGGRFISAALAPDNTITYTWLDAASQVLTLASLS